MSAVEEGIVYATIQLAVISAVYPDKRQVDMRTLTGGRTVYGCPIPSGYVHWQTGAGLHVMPEVGARVWACFPSERDLRPFPIAYANMDDAGGSRSNIPYMAPGSMFLMTRDGNAVRVHRGGLVELEATPLCAIRLLPREELVSVVAKDFVLETPIIKVAMTVGEEGEFLPGSGSSSVRAEIRSFSGDENPSVVFEAGGDELVGDGKVLRTTVRDPRTEEVLAESSISAAGDVEIRTTGDSPSIIRIERDGNVTIESDSNVNVHAKGNISLDGDRVEIGADALQGILRGSAASQIFASHTHPVSGANTGTPNPPNHTFAGALSGTGFVGS